MAAMAARSIFRCCSAVAPAKFLVMLFTIFGACLLRYNCLRFSATTSTCVTLRTSAPRLRSGSLLRSTISVNTVLRCCLCRAVGPARVSGTSSEACGSLRSRMALTSAWAGAGRTSGIRSSPSEACVRLPTAPIQLWSSLKCSTLCCCVLSILVGLFVGLLMDLVFRALFLRLESVILCPRPRGVVTFGLILSSVGIAISSKCCMDCGCKVLAPPPVRRFCSCFLLKESCFVLRLRARFCRSRAPGYQLA